MTKTSATSHLMTETSAISYLMTEASATSYLMTKISVTIQLSSSKHFSDSKISSCQLALNCSQLEVHYARVKSL